MYAIRSYYGEPDTYLNETGPFDRRRAAVGWWLRRIQGKLLSILRLLKAALTFSEGFDYLIWKITRLV